LSSVYRRLRLSAKPQAALRDGGEIYLVRRRGGSLRLQERQLFEILHRAKEAAVLSYTRWFLLGLSLLLLAVLGSSAHSSEPKPTSKQIAQWIEQLGDNDFKVRENASKKLWQAGAAAESALERALKSDDPEVVRRTRELLDKFHWGIYPDTPADIVALIHLYQSLQGNPNRMGAVKILLDKDDAGLRALRKIAAAEKDENQRKALGELVAQKLPSAFLLAVTEDKYEPFERLLEFGHEGKFIGNNPYAAYWLLRGQLPERIAHFRARLHDHPEDKWFAETLAYLHRADGDLSEARKAAEKSGRADLLEGILFELADWKALAERPESAATTKPANEGAAHNARAENPAERCAYRAAFARLAGKQNEFENAVRELRKFGESKVDHDSLAFLAAKGLLLNDRPAEGLNLLRTLPNRRDLLFDILCARLEFGAAIELAMKAVPNDKETPSLDLARARLLCLLGEKEGESLFERYAEHIKDEADPHWIHLLLKEEMRAGLKDRAFAHAAKALSVAPPKNGRPRDNEARERLYVAPLFPQQTNTAEAWWTVLRRQFKYESPAVVLKRLQTLLEGKAQAKDVTKWIEQAEKWVWETQRPVVSSDIPWENMQSWGQILAEGAILTGLDGLALSLLKKEDRPDAFHRLGDRLAAKKQWAKAAESYQRAWKKKISHEWGGPYNNALTLYLEGDAFVHAGRETEGKKLIEQAHWIPLADAGERHDLLSALTERGHKEAAQRETELLLRVSEPNTYHSGAAIRRLAVAALARKDYLKAAEGFEQSMMRCFSPFTNFVSNAAYVNVPAQIHQLRASALLAAGKLGEALRHVELALTYSPGYVDLPIALVPELERRGHKKEATDLFNRCYGAYEKVCRAYPRCAWAHNSAAWMSACCHRNLDPALQHAEKAVELSPTHAGYLDTLAEVHFQRGDNDKAVALQKRVIEMDPKKAYFRKQLKRLEAGDPSAERPPENEEE
jgi:hypothetical protein